MEELVSGYAVSHEKCTVKKKAMMLAAEFLC